MLTANTLYFLHLFVDSSKKWYFVHLRAHATLTLLQNTKETIISIRDLGTPLTARCLYAFTYYFTSQPAGTSH